MKNLLASVSLAALVVVPGLASAQPVQFGNYDYQTPVACSLTPGVCTFPISLTGAGAGTWDSADLQNSWGKGVTLGINIAAKTGTIAVVVKIQGKDLASGKYYDLCTSASLTSATFTTLGTYPGATTTANVQCALPLPATWRVDVVSGTGSTPVFTLGIGASLIE